MTRTARRWTGGALAAALLVVLGPSVPGGGPRATAAGSCDTAPVAGPTVKVMVIGDSLSHGSAGDFTWRYRFWEAQREQGVNIVFVGPYTGLLRTWDTPVDNNQFYGETCFDQREHFAVGGRDLANVLTPITQYCPDGRSYSGSQVAWATYCYQPDVVLGFMGYNDLKVKDTNAVWGQHGYTADQVLANAKVFVQQVQAGKAGTPVGMAKVLSTKVKVVVDGSAYNAKLATAVPAWQGEGLPVGLVDPTVRWKASPTDTWDDFHPNAQGEVHLAWDVAHGLHALVPEIDSLDEVALPAVPLGPRVPGTLSLQSGTPTSVTLAWTFPHGADKEVLYQADSTDGVTWSGWTKVQDTTYATGATRTGLDERLYRFRVQAAKGSAVATDVFSDVLSVDLRPIGSVEPVVVTPARHAVTLSWTKATSATSYTVRWRRTGTSSWVSRSTGQLSFPVTGLVAGVRYDYQVVPVRSGVSGQPSTVGSRMAVGTVNPAVPRPTVRKVSRHRLRVTWRRAADATRYQVRIRPARGAWRTLGWTTGTTLTSPRLVKGRTYAVAVVAWDSYVAGRRSAAARFRVR